MDKPRQVKLFSETKIHDAERALNHWMNLNYKLIENVTIQFKVNDGDEWVNYHFAVFYDDVQSE